MAAPTSATVTVDPPAVKKRGRPRKVVDESAAVSEKPAARKASTKAKAAPKASPKVKTVDALKEKKKTLTKVSDYKTRKATPKSASAPAPKAAPTEIAEQVTPATPTSSKILDEVKAAGAFNKPSPEPKEPFLPPVPGPAPVAPILPAAAKTPIAPTPETHYEAPSSPSTEPTDPFLPPVPGPAPVAPILPAAAKTPIANADATPAPKTHSERPSSAPASGAPIQQPVDGASSKPRIPPTTAAPSERAPPKARATTIPLPQKPRTAPSPYPSLKQRTAFAEPAAPRAPPRAPRYPQRIIEPTPNTKLPPKYKKAARQVTSIIVGIPIILVVGWELYGRWRMQIGTKFEEREKRRRPEPLSAVGEK
ncbi:hypothetical protein N0V91_000147 [Didymella pomorum]|uniref:Uncharacterized protein n=1 Tax=Didymella pomorum TaxID=749634 RepID=A0A9W9DD00_9PLEO|nr:hypothetical protein N0V91_000147 [Didymella pomorum]